jgi:hypothetical protein
MSRSSRDRITNASSSLKNEESNTFAAEHQQQETDGATITLPLSIGPSTSNQNTETEGVVSIKRYMDLQDEFARLAKKYRFMHDEFAEMRIELDRLRKEREQAWLKKR